MRPAFRAPHRIALLLLLALAALAIARTGTAQTAEVSVAGVAFDSLHMRPLADALIAIQGTGKSTTTDSRGQFHFDSLAAGSYSFVLQHALLDSLGLSGIATQSTVSSAGGRLILAIPPFGRFWRGACGARAEPVDSGVIHGVVMDAVTRQPAKNARVQLSWIDLSVEGKKDIKQRRFTMETIADDRGTYGLCGVPLAVALSMRANTVEGSSGTLEFQLERTPVSRHDMLVGRRDNNTAFTGTIVGRVADTSGAPIADALVSTDGVNDIRSSASGAFTLRNVPAGSRQVEVKVIGLTPDISTVDVFAADTAFLNVTMKKVVTLASMNVTEKSVRTHILVMVDERKAMGLGKVIDSTEVAGHGTLSSVFRTFPGLKVDDRVGQPLKVSMQFAARYCDAAIWLDNRMVDAAYLNTLRPDDVAVMEVYPRALLVPPEFAKPGSLCGALVIWTKTFMRT